MDIYKKLDIYKLTVEELLEMGADLRVTFYENITEQEAYEKIKRFNNFGLGRINTYEREGTNWHESTDYTKDNIKIIAFYDKKSRAENTTKEKNIQS